MAVPSARAVAFGPIVVVEFRETTPVAATFEPSHGLVHSRKKCSDRALKIVDPAALTRKESGRVTSHDYYTSRGSGQNCGRLSNHFLLDDSIGSSNLAGPDTLHPGGHRCDSSSRHESFESTERYLIDYGKRYWAGLPIRSVVHRPNPQSTSS